LHRPFMSAILFQSVNGILCLRYLFNSYTASYTLPILSSPLSNSSFSSSMDYSVYAFVPVIFAVVKCPLRNFSWNVQECIFVAAWNSSTKEKWQFYSLQNKWKYEGGPKNNRNLFLLFFVLYFYWTLH
jgi:hypothetical protein